MKQPAWRSVNADSSFLESKPSSIKITRKAALRVFAIRGGTFRILLLWMCMLGLVCSVVDCRPTASRTHDGGEVGNLGGDGGYTGTRTRRTSWGGARQELVSWKDRLWDRNNGRLGMYKVCVAVGGHTSIAMRYLR